MTMVAAKRRATETVGRMGVTEYSGLRINVAQLLKSPTGETRRLELSDDIAGIDE
jgi:hypothetical protein